MAKERNLSVPLEKKERSLSVPLENSPRNRDGYGTLEENQDEL